MQFRLLFFAAPLLSIASLCAAQSPIPSTTAQNSRFAGSATVVGPAGVSADGRFRSDAAFLPPGTKAWSDEKTAPAKTFAPPPLPIAYAQTGGRFGLNAELLNPDRSKAITVACTAGPENIFANGFE